MGMTKHSHHHHLMVILSPRYTGLQREQWDYSHNYWKRQLTSVNLATSNSFWSNTRINVSQKRNVMKFRTGPLYAQKMAHLYSSLLWEPLIHLVCCVISQTVKSICFLAVRLLQFKTSWWWLPVRDITLLPGSSSKP